MRNYGGLEGLPELRAIFGELLGVDTAQVICGGNSSLTMMHQALTWLLLKGGPDSERPWSQEPVVKFITPVPGYDRHYTMLAELGIEMLPVPMLRGRPGRRRDQGAGRRRPGGQGHVAGADVREPDRLGDHHRGRRRADGDADGGT